MTQHAMDVGTFEVTHSESDSYLMATTATHWCRGRKAYGGPPPCALVADLWWPTSDPNPTDR